MVCQEQYNYILKLKYLSLRKEEFMGIKRPLGITKR